MAGTTEEGGSKTRPWRLQTGNPQLRVLNEKEELQRSALPPLEVKVSSKKSSEKLNIGEYETGTSRG